MVRRYLQRKRIDSASEDKKFVTENGPKLDVTDIENVDQRQISLKDRMQPPTPIEKVRIETRNAMDKVGNVGQYVKYVNHHIERRNSEVQNIKAKKDMFDKEVALLKSDREETNLSSYVLPKLKKEELSELKKSLVLEQTKQKIYLNKLKEQVLDAEAALQNLDKEVNQLDRYITASPTPEDQTTKIIKDKMSALSKKYDTKTITEILDALESSLQ